MCVGSSPGTAGYVTGRWSACAEVGLPSGSRGCAVHHTAPDGENLLAGSPSVVVDERSRRVEDMRGRGRVQEARHPRFEWSCHKDQDGAPSIRE